MPSEQTFTFYLMLTAQNYQVSPELSQSDVDFRTLAEAMHVVFDPSRYGITLGSPDFYIDLKAQSLIRAQDGAALQHHLDQVAAAMADAWHGEAFFRAPDPAAVVAQYNGHHHHPAIFPLMVKGESTAFFEWSNEHLSGHLQLGTQQGKPTAGVLNDAAVAAFKTVFPAIDFESDFMLHVQQNKDYQDLLLWETRERLNEKDKRAFDKKMARINKLSGVANKLMDRL